MEFTKFDINKHDLDKVTELIFETEPDLQSLLFGKNKQKAFLKVPYCSVERSGDISSEVD